MEVVVNEWPGQFDPQGATWLGPHPSPPAGGPPGPWQQPSQAGGWGQQPPAPGGTWPPPGQQPPPGPGQPFGQPGQPYGPPLFMPPKSRKPLFIGLSIAGALLVVVAIVLAFTLALGGSGGGGSAGDAVKGYLEALARGDAEGALSYSNDQPASKDLVSSDVLKKQIAQWPISDIRILNDDSTSSAIGIARVHVVANFGDKASDATLNLKKDHGKWKLDSSTIKVAPPPSSGDDAAAKTITLFGKRIADTTVYVFPGWLDFASSNPYLTVTTKPMLLDQLALGGSGWLRPTVDVSEGGRQAVNAQLQAAFANCQRSNLLAPPGCPLHINPEGMVEGTANWGQADLSGIKLETFDTTRMSLRFFGDVKQPLTVKGANGNLKVGNVSRLLSGSADMTQTPPALTF
jgi:hypothetical protein